jgi:single-stranded-DNA-specific exonuclease
VLLLLTEDKAEAALYARELREANRERQALDAKVQQEALAWAEANFSYDSDMAVVAASGNWHPGVIGIAASRVVENFNRPAILFSTGPDGRAKGSGRSIPGLHLLDALTECSDLLESFGGHAAAAGATIRIENLDAFREKFNLAVKKRISPEALNPVITADAEIDIPSISRKFFNVLRRMEPFGPGNMRPVLLCRGCTHRYQPKTVGRGHLKMTISQHGGVMDAIAFNFGDRLDEIRSAAPFDIAFSLDENTWNNQVSLQMKVKGVRA